MSALVTSEAMKNNGGQEFIEALRSLEDFLVMEAQKIIEASSLLRL
jgi:hypothetical protein